MHARSHTRQLETVTTTIQRRKGTNLATISASFIIIYVLICGLKPESGYRHTVDVNDFHCKRDEF